MNSLRLRTKCSPIDRIVTGFRGHGYHERILRESTLTLQKDIDICRTNEMAASQRHRAEQSGTIHFTSREEKKRGPHENPRRNPCPTRPSKYCGDTHATGNCHAYSKTCAKCNKKNRLVKDCQSTCKPDSNRPKPEREKPGKHQRVDLLQQNQILDELSGYESVFTLHKPKGYKKEYVASVIVSANNEDKSRAKQVSSGHWSLV